MSMEKSARPARVIVVGNEKGGSGKSTVAMHVAVALMKARQTVATIDLDSRQRSLTHYVDNRRAWSRRIGRELDVPQHLCPDASVGDESERCTAFADAIDALAEHHGFIVIDTPGHDGALSRLAHSMADTLITPLNDSFLDFDVLGTVDPETFAVSDASHYAQMVQEVRRQRSLEGRIDRLGGHEKPAFDAWHPEQASGRRRAARAIAKTGIPNGRRLRRTDDLPGVLSSGADGAR